MEKKKGYKKTEIGWIPEDWEAVKSSQIASVKGGNGFPQKHQGEKTGDIPFIKVSDMNSLGNEKYITVANNYVSKELAEKLKLTLFEKDSIVFAKVGAALLLNRRRILSHTTIIDNNMMGMIPKKDTNTQYLYQFYLRVDFSKLVQEGALPSINQKMVGNILVPYPPLPEQTKIADILTTVDDKISSIDSQIQQTEQLKKGLMEKLLTEGIGHTEFKETEIGRIPKGWDFGELNTISDLQVVYAFKSTWFSNAGISLLRGENVGYGAPDWSNNKCLSHEQSKEYSGYFLKENDIVIGMDRTFTKSGVKISKITDNDLPSLLVQRVGRFLPSKCDNDFLWQLVRSEYYLLSLQNQQKGMDIPHLSKSEIMSILVAIPPLPEQKKIATILSTVDDKLDILNQKKSHFQTLKKGLSQQLLTGQMRVKV